MAYNKKAHLKDNIEAIKLLKHLEETTGPRMVIAK